MKVDNFHHLEHLDYCLHLQCYIHNILANASFCLLKCNSLEVAGSIPTMGK